MMLKLVTIPLFLFISSSFGKIENEQYKPIIIQKEIISDKKFRFKTIIIHDTTLLIGGISGIENGKSQMYKYLMNDTLDVGIRIYQGFPNSCIRYFSRDKNNTISAFENTNENTNIISINSDRLNSKTLNYNIRSLTFDNQNCIAVKSVDRDDLLSIFKDSSFSFEPIQKLISLKSLHEPSLLTCNNKLYFIGSFKSNNSQDLRLIEFNLLNDQYFTKSISSFKGDFLFIKQINDEPTLITWDDEKIIFYNLMTRKKYFLSFKKQDYIAIKDISMLNQKYYINAIRQEGGSNRYDILVSNDNSGNWHLKYTSVLINAQFIWDNNFYILEKDRYLTEIK